MKIKSTKSNVPAQPVYRVFRDLYGTDKEVLSTLLLDRALVAMDSMFDENSGGTYEPNRARIEKDGVVIETRSADKAMKILHNKPTPEIHHHAPPSIWPFEVTRERKKDKPFERLRPHRIRGE